jgi:hypothetical protein
MAAPTVWKPLLFQSAMVRALLNTRPGTWPAEPLDPAQACKSVTRRLVKWPANLKRWRVPDWSRAWVDPGGTIFGPGPYLHVPDRHVSDPWEEDPEDDVSRRVYCPYGYPEEGVRFWVREAFQASSYCPGEYGGVGEVGYPLHAQPPQPPAGSYVVDYRADGYEDGPWRPSIHMPRWAARLFLELVSLRCERVSDITEEDARAEGCPPDHPDPVAWFRELWCRINGAETWGAWVWALGVRRVEGGPA